MEEHGRRRGSTGKERMALERGNGGQGGGGGFVNGRREAVEGKGRREV